MLAALYHDRLCKSQENTHSRKYVRKQQVELASFSEAQG